MAFFYRLRYVLSVAKIRASNSEKVVSVPKPIHFMSLFLLLSFLLPIGALFSVGVIELVFGM